MGDLGSCATFRSPTAREALRDQIGDLTLGLGDETGVGQLPQHGLRVRLERGVGVIPGRGLDDDAVGDAQVRGLDDGQQPVLELVTEDACALLLAEGLTRGKCLLNRLGDQFRADVAHLAVPITSGWVLL